MTPVDAVTSGGESATLRVTDVGPVRFVVLARPDMRNCLDFELRRELARTVRAADTDPRCRAMVLTGEGPVFCAGGDIKTLNQDLAAGRTRLELAGDVTRAILQSDTPVVAAVNGGAWGAGLAIAAACDVVVLGRTATLVASFGRFGLVGDTGTFFVLAERMGRARARELLLLNASLGAKEAVANGLATTVVDDAEVRRAAYDIARHLAGAAQGVNASTKSLLREGETDFEQILEAEIKTQLALLAGPHFAEGQRAFVEKREPAWWMDLDVDPPTGLLDVMAAGDVRWA